MRNAAPWIDSGIVRGIVGAVKHFVIGLISLSALTQVGSADDWPHFRGPKRTGVSSETGWFPAGAKLNVVWKKQVGLGFSCVSVVGNRAYTVGYADKKDTIYCLSTKDGSEIWKYSFKATKGALFYQGGTSATPTIDDGRLYHCSRPGLMICLDAKSGKLVWQKHLKEDYDIPKPTWGFASSPLVMGDRIYLNAGEAGTALNKRDGKLIWTSGKKEAGYATPVPFNSEGRSLLAIFAEKEILTVASADGKVIWRERFNTSWEQNSADPLIYKNQLFVTGHNKKGKLFKLADGTVVEDFESEVKAHVDSGVVIGDHLYVINGKIHSSRATVDCIDLKSGKAVWSHKGLHVGALSAADNKLIIIGEKGKFVVANASPDGFVPLIEKQLLEEPCWSAPTLANGRVYCRDGKGTLVCLSFAK